MTGNKNDVACWTCRSFLSNGNRATCVMHAVELPLLGYEIFCSRYHNISGKAQESPPMRTFAQRPVHDEILYFYSYAVGPAPFELISISKLRHANILAAAIKIETEIVGPLSLKIEIKKCLLDLAEIIFLIDGFQCIGRREVAETQSLSGRRAKSVIYKFSKDDQFVIDRWLSKHYRRDKIDAAWEHRPALKNYGVHIFILLQFDPDILQTAELLVDGLANAVIYGGNPPES